MNYELEELDLNRAKEIIIHWAESKPFITKVYLFGSRVTGVSKKTGKPARLDSDLDVAIEFENFSDKENSFTTWICEKKNWHKELSDLLGFSKDEQLDLECHRFGETPHISQYLKSGSVLIYSYIK